MYNIFYVESPLQLLSAINAKIIFQGKSILIINISSEVRANNAEQINALLNEDDWLKIHRQKQYKNRYLLMFFSFFRMLVLFFKYKNKVDRFCFGEFRNIDMTILGSLINANEQILLDDGTFTITAQRHYIKKNKLPFEIGASGIKLKLLFYRLFFGWKLDGIKSPNLCSFFDLGKYMLDDQINYFKTIPPQKIPLDENTIYYFGSKFSEAGYLDQSCELDILKFIFKEYCGENIYYIPHRDESSSKLELVQKIGYKIKNLGCPAEVFFNETKVMPLSVISSYSTTLYSCFMKFSNVNVVAIDIREYIKHDAAKINADNIYPYYQDIGIKVKKIDLYPKTDMEYNFEPE